MERSASPDQHGRSPSRCFQAGLLRRRSRPGQTRASDDYAESRIDGRIKARYNWHMEFSAAATLTQQEPEHLCVQVTSNEPGGPDGELTPVATITAPLRPGGPDPDPFVSEEHRVGYLLREIGWQPVEAVVFGAPFRVARYPSFRANVVTYEGESIELVQVRNNDGEILAELPVTSTPEAALCESGWDVLGAAGGGWPEDVLAVAPSDWLDVVRRARTERDGARREADRREKFWASCLREAILAGHTAVELAGIAGVTAQRIYQIRDRRR